MEPANAGVVEVAFGAQALVGTGEEEAGCPPPRYHTVKYAGVLAAASRWRSRIAPACPDAIGSTDKEQEREPKMALRSAAEDGRR